MFVVDEYCRAVTAEPGGVTCLARVERCVVKQAPVQILCWMHLSHINTPNKCNKHWLSQSSDSRDMMNLTCMISITWGASLNSPGLHWLYFEYPASGVWTISAKNKKVPPLNYCGQSCTDVWLHGLFRIMELFVGPLIQLGPAFKKVKDAKWLLILY